MDGEIKRKFDGYYRNRLQDLRIELRLRVASYENLKFTFWLVLAKFHCFEFISYAGRLPNDVETEPGRHNRSVNVMLDEYCNSHSKWAWYDAAAIKICREKDAEKDWFVDYGKSEKFQKSAFL